MNKLWKYGLSLLLLVSVILTVFLVIFLRESTGTVIVKTSVGSIQGMRSASGDFNMFLGIPYAKVNESNPFGASNPYATFDGVYNANDNSKVCPQMDSGRAIGALDCLHLSISVPDSASSNPLPVMVWIHGGAFEQGSSHPYGPKYLVKHDVVFVAINYRIGPYGFMCLDTPDVPGNQGLKDQVLALRWIKNNIEAFGGDVDNITVFGMSAGGHSIDFHILSDTEILFNNAIMQSGSAVASTVFTEHHKTAPINIASQLGYETSSISDAISLLSTLNTSSVLLASAELDFVYKPCTEMKFENVESFLTTHWITADTSKAKEIPLIIGYNEHELLLRYIFPHAFDNYNAIRKRLSETFNFNENQMNENEQIIRQFYFGDRNITYEEMWSAVDFDSDFTYIYPIRRTINKYLASGAENIYLYCFAYNGGRNAQKVPSGVNIGSAVHADESGYLFDLEVFPNKPEPADKLVLDKMTTMWTNFAKFSDPTPELSPLLPVRWPTVNQDTYDYMEITSELKPGQRPIHERMTFWDIFYEINKQYEKGYIENL